MAIPLYQVDAFTERPFAGNPAAVCPLGAWPSDTLMQAIALENNLSETAFCVPDGDRWGLRWFTPTVEVDLCGHATLATGFVLLEVLGAARDEAAFTTRSGRLTVRRAGHRFAMDLPANPPEAFDAPVEMESALAVALGTRPAEVLATAGHYVAVMPDAAAVRGLQPDMGALARLDRPAVMATAPAAPDDRADIVSRFFAPAKGVPEDPVTGSAHCVLAPFWSTRLGRDEIEAIQASPRGGRMTCRVAGNRVEMTSGAVLVLTGEIHTDHMQSTG